MWLLKLTVAKKWFSISSQVSHSEIRCVLLKSLQRYLLPVTYLLRAMWHIRPRHNPANQLCQPLPTSLQFFHPASALTYSYNLYPHLIHHSRNLCQFPILICALGVISGLFSSWASSRLWLKGVILCLPKQGTTLAPREGCLRVFKVSVICFVLRGRVIGPPPNPQPGGPGAVLCLVSTPRPIRHG